MTTFYEFVKKDLHENADGFPSDEEKIAGEEAHVEKRPDADDDDDGVGGHSLDIVLHEGGDVSDGHGRHDNQPQDAGPFPDEGEESLIEDPQEGTERGLMPVAM